jgi:hypothetical protein
VCVEGLPSEWERRKGAGKNECEAQTQYQLENKAGSTAHTHRPRIMPSMLVRVSGGESEGVGVRVNV